VDFICRKLKLVVEIDGYSHRFKEYDDKERDQQLSKLGYSVIRFSESDVRNDLGNVIRVLESYLPGAKP
jgi:very-short-patch-repair endonuclease